MAAAGKRKRDFSEDDAYLILHKYTPATILTALQEVARQTERRRRIDWSALVARTATGITSAREYQMLWRYVAYGHDFVENVDKSAQPLGDESDLECEIEPFPTPSSQALAEASGFAKILFYGTSPEQDSSAKSAVPVLNTPNGKIRRVPSDKQLGQSHRPTNGTDPVSNSKQTSHTGLSPDPFVGNGPHPKNKKPKPWSKEEDSNLTTGVRTCGEGNWLDMMHKYSFDNTRSAVQLSQRWALISKRQGTTKPANATPVSAKFDRIKATQEAVSFALDGPMGQPGLSTLRRSGPSHQSTQHHAPAIGTATPDFKSAANSSLLALPVPLQVQKPLAQVQRAPAQAAPLRVSNTLNKSRNNSKKQAAQTNPTNAPSSIQAAAIAAGGRIATPSVATKFLKAAQSTKAVRVRSRGTGYSKTCASSKPSSMAGESGTQLGGAQHPELPNRSALTSSPPVLTTPSTEQVNVVPEVAGVNPLERSASAHFLEAERTLSTKLACDNMEMDDDSTYCAVTMEDLFPEDVKQPDIVDPKDADSMLEFDRFVESQKKQPKQLPPAGKSTAVFARSPSTTVKKVKTIGSHESPTSSGLVGTGNAGVLSKALGGQPSGPGTTGKQNRCQEIMAQNQRATNSKCNGRAKNAHPGTRTPARNVTLGAGAPGRNGALGTVTQVNNTARATGPLAKSLAPDSGSPANRQYNPMVSGARKGNPTASK